MTIWYESKSKIIDVEFPRGASLGISESLENGGKVSVERDVRGGGLLYRTMWRRAWKVTLSASGKGIRWSPAVDGLEEGSEVTLYCATSQTARIPAGQSSVVLSRPAVPGSLLAHRYSDDERLVVNLIAGNTAVLAAAQADVVTVKYRPILQCFYLGATLRSSEGDGTQTWELLFEEVAAS